MGGASRREILSIKPETFFCAVFETAVKNPSLVCLTSRMKGGTKVEGCQGAHSAESGRRLPYVASREPQVAHDGRLVMASRMRGSVLWAWVGLVVAGLGFRKMTEYDHFVRVAHDKALVGVAFVALAAVTAGCAPVAFVTLRKALAEGRSGGPGRLRTAKRPVRARGPSLPPAARRGPL